jgi:hypothetical protein
MATPLKFITAYLLILLIMLFFFGLNVELLEEELSLEQPEAPIPSNSTFDDLFNTLEYYTDSISFYSTIMTATPVSTVISSIFVLFTLVMLYIFIREIFIPFLEAIGSIIPFT